MEWFVTEVHPSLDATMKVVQSTPSGADIVAAKLDSLNNRYIQLIATIRGKLKDYSEKNPGDKIILVS